MSRIKQFGQSFWIGLLVVLGTATAAVLLAGNPAVQAGPVAADDLQSYPVPLDLVADKLEVTQAIQDLNNSVRLVANKRTYVRFHVHSNSGTPVTTAVLVAQQGASSVTLSPINPGNAIGVGVTPNRGTLNQAFLFELPNGFKEGTVSLTARVNPVNNPVEGNTGNNQINTSVTFETVPPVNLVMYRITYNIGANTYTASSTHSNQMLSWLRRAYPLSDLRVWNRTLNYGAGTASNGNLTNPTCGTVNSRLQTAKVLDIIFKWFGWSSVPTSAHYYGMVSDGGGFMRGCVIGFPGSISSGPTGSSTWGWDTDGSYGDWYGAHELAHSYLRYHAMFCGAGGGVAYPYANGNISPTGVGNNAIYGFDIANQAIYGPTWKDVMTYCSNQWISDFTYEGLMTYFKTNPVRSSDGLVRIEAGDRLLIGGTIDPATGVVNLEPIYRVPEIAEVTNPTPGDYAIVLRGSDNQELARYPFTPLESAGGPTDTPGEREVVYLLINELVPYVEGTVRVDIEGPGNKVLGSAAPGSAAPQITLTSPNGGETLGGSTVEITWTASDADKDPLTFMVQYSPDAGQTWMVAAQNVTGNSYTMDTSNLVGSTQARFRVWASDGLNTTFDDSDADNTVPDHAPQVTITAPDAGSTTVVSETVTLAGTGYDDDTGTLSGAALEWLSDRDGSLGTGETLSIATLSVGEHTITLRTADGKGGFVSQTVKITVVAKSEDAPVANALLVAPKPILLDAKTQISVTQVTVDNQNVTDAIAWNVSTEAAWLQLSKTSGTTPDSLSVEYVGNLMPGSYETTLVFTSASISGQEFTLPVMLEVPRFEVFLPSMLK